MLPIHANKRLKGHAVAKEQQTPKKKAMRPSGSKAENAQLLTIDYEMLAAAIIRQQELALNRLKSPRRRTGKLITS